MAETKPGWTWMGGLRLAAALTLLAAAPAAAQSLLERTPNLDGTWVGEAGVLHFHFMHRFDASEAPARKVSNTPTFLLAGSLPGNLLVGARYATSSLVAPGFPNEWEFFGRLAPLSQERGSPVDVALHAAYNQAAHSGDAQLAFARTLGPVRLLAAGRAFSNGYRSDDTRFAVAGGAVFRLTDDVALAGDVATLLERRAPDDGAAGDDEDVAWGAGLHVRIPTTPHTLSLHYSNVYTTTLQGASLGLDDARWGFEFTIPLTLSRYFGGGGGAAGETVAAPAGEAAVVTMTNRLTYEPSRLRIKVGQTVEWRNTSDVEHTVTADPAKAQRASSVRLPEGASAFDSGTMPPGATFSHTFDVPGEYTYFCIPHELAGMVGTIVVER